MSLKENLLNGIYTQTAEVSEECPTDNLIRDEEGNAFTIEEAQAMDEELAKNAELFFANHTYTLDSRVEEALDEALQPTPLEEDPEQLTITLNTEGEVIGQTTVIKEKENVLVLAPFDSFVNDLILTNVIQRHIEKMNEVETKLVRAFESLPYVYSNQDAMVDNLIDKSRKERRELAALLALEPIELDKLKNDDLRRQLKQETKESIAKMFQITDMLD